MHGSVQPPTSCKFKLVAMCNKSNRSSFQLTPKHGKEAYALVVIASMTDDILFAESVEQVMEDERKLLEVTMLQEMNLAIHLMKAAGAQSPAVWDENTSPLKAATCRVIGRSPTGPDMDPLDITPAKKPRIE